MKSVLISIQPKWCEKIASGEKTIEVRKTKPKLKTPFKCYIYMTKSRVTGAFAGWDCAVITSTGDMYYGGGKVIGEFVCDTFVTDYTCGKDALFNGGACITKQQATAYANGKTLYGWHISDLKIYDKPKELCEFVSNCDTLDKHCYNCRHFLFAKDFYGNTHRYCGSHYRKEITRPPQSWCYVEK